MKLILSTFEILEEIINPEGKTVLDIGCGIGENTRRLVTQKAKVIGIDRPELISKAHEFPRNGDEIYREGLAEKLPVDDKSADIALYMASFHHIQKEHMPLAIKECKRVLKHGGIAIFVEPVAKDSSWYEITRFFSEEEPLRQAAYDTIRNSGGDDFLQLLEKFYYMERTLNDFIKHLDIYVPDPEIKSQILAKSKSVYDELQVKSGLSSEDFRLKSVMRLNLFVRP